MSAARKYMIVIWTETMWVAMSRKNYRQIRLCEAAGKALDLYALRRGNKVTVRSGRRFSFVFDAETTVVSGFGTDKDGKPLSKLMEEGIVYNYNLLPEEPPVYAGRLLFDRRKKAA